MQEKPYPNFVPLYTVPYAPYPVLLMETTPLKVIPLPAGLFALFLLHAKRKKKLQRWREHLNLHCYLTVKTNVDMQCFLSLYDIKRKVFPGNYI